MNQLSHFHVVVLTVVPQLDLLTVATNNDFLKNEYLYHFFLRYNN